MRFRATLFEICRAPLERICNSDDYFDKRCRAERTAADRELKNNNG